MGTTPFDYKSTYGATKYKSWEGDSPWETPKDFHLRSNVSIFGDANLATEQKVIAILESHFRFPYCPSPGYFLVIFSCQSSSIPTSLIHSFIN